MKKAIILLLLTTGLFTGAIAQNDTASGDAPATQPRDEIGFAAGFVTGYGLSYRHWPKKLGFQVTAFPMVSNSSKNLSVGLTGLYELDARRWYRFFAFLGNHYNYDETKVTDQFVHTSGLLIGTIDSNTYTQIKRRYIVGFGPGIEFTPGRHVGINIMTGFQFQYANKDDWGSYPTIETGIYFRF